MNGQALVAAIKECTGIGIEIISGEEEADLIYTASSYNNLTASSGTTLYVDVGGGSTELIVYKNNELLFHDSFSVGTVRMLSCVSGGNNTSCTLEKERLLASLKDIRTNHVPTRMVASGGNINKVQKMLGKKNGSPLSADELNDLLAKLKPLSMAERMRMYALNHYRADVIVPALEIFLCISRECSSIRTLYVPKTGLADGLIHDMCKTGPVSHINTQENKYVR